MNKRRGYWADLKGRITYVNDAFVKISGFSCQELIGASHNIIRHLDTPAEAFEDLWATLKQGKPWSTSVKNRTRSGDYYWVEANVVPVYKNGVLHEYLSACYAPSRRFRFVFDIEFVFIASCRFCNTFKPVIFTIFL